MIVLGAGPRLGVVEWLWRSLRDARGPIIWSRTKPPPSWQDEARQRLDDGAAVVIGSWAPGVIQRADLIAHPAALGLIAANPAHLTDLDPDFGPPDMVLDDAAPWAIAAAVAFHHRVDGIEQGGRRDLALPPPGIAWLVGRAMRWGELTPPEIEGLLA